MKRFNLCTLPKKLTLSKPKKLILSKPKKLKLVNPDIINIINNSSFYNSSFDDPTSTGLALDQLCYRLTPLQKERWIDGILNNDPRIFRIKQRKNFVILICTNSMLGNNVKSSYRYITFYDENKGEYDVEKEKTTTKKEKNRIHNVSYKSRIKRKNKRKGRRK